MVSSNYDRPKDCESLEKEILVHRIHNKENTNIIYKYETEYEVYLKNLEDRNILFN